MSRQVDEEKLEVLINHIDFVVVLFYKENDPASKNAALDVDSIDDNLKERGISIVKTKNKDQIEMSVGIFKQDMIELPGTTSTCFPS